MSSSIILLILLNTFQNSLKSISKDHNATEIPQYLKAEHEELDIIEGASKLGGGTTKSTRTFALEKHTQEPAKENMEEYIRFAKKFRQHIRKLNLTYNSDRRTFNKAREPIEKAFLIF